MGAFDDLPDAGSAGGAFDDLPDVAAPPKRQVGALEGGARGVGRSYASTGRALAAAASTPFMLADKIASMIYGRPVTAAQDFAFSAAEPALEAPKYYEINPATEELTTGGRIANVGGELAGGLQQMFAMPGAVAPNTGRLLLSAVKSRAPLEAARIAAPQIPAVITKGAPMIVPPAIDQGARVAEAGGGPGDVARVAGANALANAAAVAVPLSATGNLATRVATGVGLGVPANIAQRAITNAALGDQYQQLQTPALDPGQVGTDALLMGAMAALFGPRAGPVRVPSIRTELPTPEDIRQGLIMRDVADTAVPYDRTPVPSSISLADVYRQAGNEVPHSSEPGQALNLENRLQGSALNTEAPTAPAVRPLDLVPMPTRPESAEAAAIRQQGRFQEEPEPLPAIRPEFQPEPGIPFIGDTEPPRPTAGLLEPPGRIPMRQTVTGEDVRPDQLNEAHRPSGPSGEAPILGAPAKRSTGAFDDLPDVAPRAKPTSADMLTDAEYRRELGAMRDEVGWAEQGGRLVREKQSEVAGDEKVTRTQWVPHAGWYPELKRGPGKGMTNREIQGAVNKALAGGKLSKRQQGVVDWMLDDTHSRFEQSRPAETKTPNPETIHPVRETIPTQAETSHVDAEAQREARIEAKGKALDLPINEFVGDLKRRIPQVELRVEQHGTGDITVDLLQLTESRHGGNQYGERVLDQVKAWADARGADVHLDAKPLPIKDSKTGGLTEPMPLDKLVKWYERQGFRPIEGNPPEANHVPMVYGQPEGRYYSMMREWHEQQRQYRPNEYTSDTFETSSKRPAETDQHAELSGAGRGSDARSAGEAEINGETGQRAPVAEQRSSDLPGRKNRDDDGSVQSRRETAPRQGEGGKRSESQSGESIPGPGSDLSLDFTETKNKPGDGGTLYGGLPMDRIAAAVGKALGWAAGDSQAWRDSVSYFVDAIRDAIRKERSKSAAEGNIVLRAVRAFHESAAADVRAVIRRTNNSKTAQSIVDHFHIEAGSKRVTDETFSQSANAWTNRQLVALDKVLSPVLRDKNALQQIVAQVRNPQNIRAGTKIGDAAQKIADLLADALDHMRKSGVNVGEVKGGYFPREYDTSAIMSAPDRFKQAAAQAYREAGKSAADADIAANALHDSLLYGDVTSLFKRDRGNPQAPFLEGRIFGKKVDEPAHPLNKFLLSDPAIILPAYLQRVARRAEIAKRFGDGFSRWDKLIEQVKAEGGTEALEKLTDFVAFAAGLKSPGTSNFALRAASIARTWGSLMFLEKATLSSLTEFITPAIRTGNVLDVARSFSKTLTSLIGKTQAAKERTALAEDLGLVVGHLSDTINTARFAGGEPVTQIESRVLDKYFRRTGLTQWTDATRVAAVDLGRIFIRRLVKGGGKLDDRHLNELGVPTSELAAFRAFVAKANDGMPVAGDLNGPLGDTYRKAVRRFVSQSIMTPDKTMKPGWMSNPLGSLLGQLQSFNYAFYENVLKRNARLVKEAALNEAGYTTMERAQLVMPMLMLPLLVAGAYAIGEGRDAVLGDPNRRKKETTGDKVIKAMSRGTPIAPLDPYLNYATSARYQRGAVDFAAGPVGGTLGRGVDAARNVLLNNSPNTNTAERQAAKAAYDIFIEPTVNLMLTMSPVSPLAAGATQVAGAGGVREKFVSGIAGPEKKSGGKTF